MMDSFGEASLEEDSFGEYYTEVSMTQLAQI
jgi:hypothetical protein